VQRDSAATVQNGHGKALHSDVSSASNKSLLRMQRSSFGATFDLDHSDAVLHQSHSGDVKRSSHDSMLTRDSVGGDVSHSSVSSSTSFQPLSQDLDDITDSTDGSISGQTWILDGPTVCGPSATMTTESDDVDSVGQEEKIAALSKMLKQTLSTGASRQNTASTRGRTTVIVSLLHIFHCYVLC